MAIQLYNVKFLLLISASFTTIFSSIAIYFCLPLLLSHIIRTQLSLSPDSGSFHDWKYNSVIDKIYLYNISNLDDILAKSARNSATAAKPIIRIKEVGPFTFRQNREKLNIRFDATNETVIYDQRKSWLFLPELSCVKSIEDLNSTWINHISVPLSGATLNSEYAELVEPMINEFELKLFLNHSANVLLFEGYHDILMESAKGAGQIDIDRFGWMYNQNNSLTRNIRVFTGPSNVTVDKIGSIDQFDFQKRWFTWHNNGSDPKETSDVKCNEFRGASAGEFFPPPKGSVIGYNNNRNTLGYQNFDQNERENDHLKSSERLEGSVEPLQQSIDEIATTGINTIPTNARARREISLFMPDICRVFHLIYNGTLDYRGLTVDRYIANEQTYDYTSNSPGTERTSTNKCYCIYSETNRIVTCPPNGMMDLITCRKGSPTTVSFPHFLYSTNDSSIRPYLSLFDDSERVTQQADHEFFMDLESTLHIPVRVQIVLQFNIHFRTEPNLSFTKDFSFLMDKLKDNMSQLAPTPPIVPQTSSRTEPTYDLYLPQMWIQSAVEVDDVNLDRLKFIQRHLKLVTPIATIVMFGLASVMLMMSAKLAYDLTYGLKSRKNISADRESNSSLNQNHDTYLDDKQKYYAMQLLDSEERVYKLSDSKCSTSERSTKDLINQSEPTTSKVDDNLTTSESQPLNG